MYPENPEGTQVIVGSMNMEYISDTARNRAHNLFRPKREPIPLGHSFLRFFLLTKQNSKLLVKCRLLIKTTHLRNANSGIKMEWYVREI